MDIFSNLKQYQLLDLQEDLKTIFMIKKNNYIRDLDNEEIEEIKYYKSLFKKYRMNLKMKIYNRLYIIIYLYYYLLIVI